MPRLLPDRIKKAKAGKDLRLNPAHRAWVRKHHCCVPGCQRLPIECAHVRSGTDGGTGLKPSDCWVVSLCRNHHEEQHRLGEAQFEIKYAVDLRALATQFAKLSPHRKSLASISD